MKLTYLPFILIVMNSCSNENTTQINNLVKQDSIEILNEKIETSAEIQKSEEKLILKKDTLYQFKDFDIQFQDGNYKLFYTDSTLPEYADGIDIYEKNVDVSDAREGSTNNIITFFLSIWENGIAVRDYSQVTKKLVIFSEETNAIHELKLSEYVFGNGNICDKPEEYKFINDSIIEVKEFEYERPRHSYFKLDSNKTLRKLSTNRKYAFTKFVTIDDSYFKGCFIQENHQESMTDDGYYEPGYYYVTEHLGINELSIMNNEILAEYGLIFHEERWEQHFTKKEWYKPLYNDVEDIISERDKTNLSIISKAIDRLWENGEEILNKKRFEWSMAG